MTSTRYERYKMPLNGFPFYMNIDIKRTPFICSKEQNRHENIELQMCTKGAGTVLLNGRKYDFGEGDIVAINSDTIHYTFTESELIYTCLIISTEWCRQMNIDYEKLNFSPIIHSSEIGALISELARLCCKPREPLSVAKSVNILLNIMIALVENFAIIDQKKTNTRSFESIEKAIAFIQNNFARKITLDEISKEVFLNKYTLCKEFKRYTGQTVFENINKFRIQKAAEYLGQGYSVTETAILCGFDSLSFFSKTFKKYMGESPSVFSKSKKNEF